MYRSICHYIKRHGVPTKFPKELRANFFIAIIRKRLLRNYVFFLKKKRGGRSQFRRAVWYMKTTLFRRVAGGFLSQSLLAYNKLQLFRFTRVLAKIKIFTYWTVAKNALSYRKFWPWVWSKWRKRYNLLKVFPAPSPLRRIAVHFRLFKKLVTRGYFLKRLFRVRDLKIKSLYIQNVYWIIRRHFFLKKKGRKSRRMPLMFKQSYRAFPYSANAQEFTISFNLSPMYFHYMNFLLRRFVVVKETKRERYNSFFTINTELYRFIQSTSNKVARLFTRKFKLFTPVKNLNLKLYTFFIPLTYLSSQSLFERLIQKRMTNTSFRLIFHNYLDRQLTFNYNYPYKFRELYNYSKHEYLQYTIKGKQKLNKKQKSEKKSERSSFLFFQQCKKFSVLKFRQWSSFYTKFNQFFQNVFHYNKKGLMLPKNRSKGSLRGEALLSFFLQRLLFIMYLLKIYPINTYKRIQQFIQQGFIKNNGVLCYKSFLVIQLADLLEYSYLGILVATGVYYWYPVGIKQSSYWYSIELRAVKETIFSFYANYWKYLKNNLFPVGLTTLKAVIATSKDLVYRYLFVFYNAGQSCGIKDSFWFLFNFALLGGFFLLTRDFLFFSIAQQFRQKYFKVLFFNLSC